jgi:uncharacterized protein (TIGR00369 family)
VTAHERTRKHRTLLEHYQAAVREGRFAFPLSELLGFRLTEVEPGYAVVDLECKEHHSNPMGSLHGGVLCAIADTAMGIAHASMLSEGESSTTTELKINFLRPVRQGKLRAIGKVIKHGKTLTVLESVVLDEEGQLVARASSTCDAARRAGRLHRPFAIMVSVPPPLTRFRHRGDRELRAVIGLEVHISSPRKPKSIAVVHNWRPSQHQCLSRLPRTTGALPVLNRRAVEMAIKRAWRSAAALTRLTPGTQNYFYPDLPKGYESRSMTSSLSGHIEIISTGREAHRNHPGSLEDDAGKSLHEGSRIRTGTHTST